MSGWQFALGCLATFRLSLLVSKEDGPAFIFRKMRKLPAPKSSAREGLSCQWCMSIWMSLLVTMFFWWRGAICPPELALYWLCFSAGGICLNQTFTKGAVN